MFVSIQKNKRQPIGEAASVTNGEYRHPAMRYKGPYIKELDFEGGRKARREGGKKKRE